MFNECKVNYVLIASKDAKVGARGARTLMAHVNSPMCPKAKLCISQRRGKGAIRVKSKSNKIGDPPIIKNKINTYICAHKRCFS
jgi:hypothetical protein